MAMLHIVNKSPFERNTLTSCLGHALAGDSVLLIEDAVVGAMAGTVVADSISAAITDKKVYVLGEDLVARGLKQERIIEGIEVVNYEGFVDLTVENDKTQSWL